MHDIVRTFLRRKSLDGVQTLALEEGARLPASLVSEVESVERRTVAELAESLRLQATDCERARLYIARYMINGREGRRFGLGFGTVARGIAAQYDDVTLRDLADVIAARDDITEHRFAEATEVLERVSAVSVDVDDPLSALVHCSAKHWLGWSLQRRGDFQRASRLLSEAADVADQFDLALRWPLRAAYGAFQVAAGQFREAIQTLEDIELREEVASLGDTETLLYTHILTAEAALWLQIPDKANREVGELQRLIEDDEGRLGHYRGYLVLLSAKLDTLWGNRAEGVHLFNYAIELFEALDPPNYSAVLDAKLELIKFAAQDGRYDVVFDRLGQLLDEAGRRGCMDARTRLLAFQARLFMDDAAPADRLRAAYDDILSRVHLMNNPRLTFMAYADLYSFARKSLGEREQTAWLARIQGLRAVLERSCYEDLYRDYVFERYRFDVEAGASEFEWELQSDR